MVTKAARKKAKPPIQEEDTAGEQKKYGLSVKGGCSVYANEKKQTKGSRNFIDEIGVQGYLQRKVLTLRGRQGMERKTH